MRAMALNLKHDLIGLGGVVERNVYLTRRYIWWDLAFFVWTVANTLTIVFIAEGHRGDGRLDRRRADDDGAADRRRRLGVPRDHLRVHHGDGRLGALGGDDRVHVHGAALAGHAPRRLGRVRGALRARARLAAVRRRRDVLPPPDARRELRRRARDPADRVGVVLRDRDDDGGAAADLAGEGRTARLRGAGDAARRLGRLLPGLGAAGLDAVGLEDLAGDLRAARDPRLDPRGPGAPVGERVAPARDRRRLDPARAARCSNAARSTPSGTGS